MSTSLIKILNLNKNIGDKAILKDVSLDLKLGETLAIIGPSGAGKSTLLRCMNFLELPNSGEIFFQNKAVATQASPQGLKAVDPLQLQYIRTHAPMVFQQFNLWSHKSVLENLVLAPIHVLKMPFHEAKNKALKILGDVGLADRANAFPAELSGGQKQRVGIARALMMDPPLILFDEPTSALDPLWVSDVLSLIEAIKNPQRSMILVTHEMAFARRVADRIIFMQDGQIISQGTSDEIFGAQQHPACREFLSPYFQSLTEGKI